MGAWSWLFVFQGLLRTPHSTAHMLSTTSDFGYTSYFGSNPFHPSLSAVTGLLLVSTQGTSTIDLLSLTALVLWGHPLHKGWSLLG